MPVDHSDRAPSELIPMHAQCECKKFLQNFQWNNTNSFDFDKIFWLACILWTSTTVGHIR